MKVRLGAKLEDDLKDGCDIGMHYLSLSDELADPYTDTHRHTRQ